MVSRRFVVDGPDDVRLRSVEAHGNPLLCLSNEESMFLRGWGPIERRPRGFELNGDSRPDPL